MKTFIHPKILLEREYLRRKEHNSRYSLRAFAASLEIPSGRLSQLLSGKRAFTLPLVERVARKLELGPKERRQLQNFVLARKHRSQVSDSQISLREDEFQLIADPVAFDMLSLLQTDNCKGEPSWLARRLGISVVEVNHYLGCLCRLNIVKEDNGRYCLSHNRGVTTTNEVPSQLIRNAHRKILQQLLNNLENVPVNERHLSSTSLAIDPEKVPQAKAMIQEFISKLSSFVETSPTSEVYRLNIQFWPSTQIKEILK